ncbi:MAG: hypothetical protein ACLSF2_09180 [Butyricicoccus sp.]
MKARVLFGVFGFAFVLLALYVFPPIVLELVVAVLCVFATYEVLGSTKLVRNHLELLLAMAVSLGLAVGHFSILPLRLESVMQGLVLVLVLLFGSFAIELKYHDVMKASQVRGRFSADLPCRTCCSSAAPRCYHWSSSCCCRCLRLGRGHLRSVLGHAVRQA